MGFEVLETIAVGPFQSNCSLLACTATKKAVLVDPGDEAELIQNMIARHDVTIVALIHTHGHLDHIGATRTMHEATSAEICLHEDDFWLYKELPTRGKQFGLVYDDTLPVQRFFDHGDTIEFGNEHVTVIHTPGHSPGSVCFHHAGDKPVVIAGDTLFHRSIGRTDLPGGNHQQLIQSIQDRLMTLDPQTVVITGHGPATTIGDEKQSNPFLSGEEYF